MRDINKALLEHEEKVLEFFPHPERLVGIFLYGSQNYNAAIEDSDVDTKAIILPSFRDFYLNKKPISKELVLENGEHCVVKDIRLVIKLFKKQNINALEILFTKYYRISPIYNSLWQDIFINNREIIAAYDLCQGAKTTRGICLSYLDTKSNDISKKVRNVFRLLNLLDNFYLSKEPLSYAEAIVMTSEQLFEIELVKIKSKEELEEFFDIKRNFVKASAIDTRETTKSDQKEIEALLNTGAAVFVRKGLKQNILREKEY